MFGFTYANFRKMLQAARRSFDMRVVGEAPQARQPSSARPTLILRHDVDLDLGAALRMADIERQLGVKATYMVMLDSPIYQLEEASARKVIRELVSLEIIFGE